jgi:hypothetical protein
VTSCYPIEVHRCFEGKCHLHLQGVRVSQTSNEQEAVYKQSSLLTSLILRLWRGRKYVLPKRRWTSTGQHGVTLYSNSDTNYYNYLLYKCHGHMAILSRVHGWAWRTRRVSDWMIGFIALYKFATTDYRQYRAIAILHNLQFTVAHALGFLVFISRFLETDL